MKMLLRWDRESAGRDVLDAIFPNQKARKAAEEMVRTMKGNHGSLTNSQMKEFAISLNEGIGAVKYSYRNFYAYVLKKMVDLGLVGRDVPLWSAAARRTVWGYSLRRLKIPKRPPGEEYDFWKAAWLMARSWNRLLDGGDGTAG
ncbi:MAG: hypothetical protein JRN39_06305 [Nitrososphaerota archaeon]|nr:hypothetical protein [Nitrososphaerota archaeon]